MAFLISFEISDTLGPVENIWSAVSFGILMMFPVLNVPTIMFLVTNAIVKKFKLGDKYKWN